MLKGFKEFIMRGNVVDLAVGVVIGAAFGKVVDGFVKAIVDPMLAALPGAKTAGLGFFIDEDKPKTFIDFSLIINSIITFLLTAAVVYFLIVMPMNKIAERRRARLGITDEEEDEAPADVALLTEIRDLLAHNGGTVHPGSSADPRL